MKKKYVPSLEEHIVSLAETVGVKVPKGDQDGHVDLPKLVLAIQRKVRATTEANRNALRGMYQ